MKPVVIDLSHHNTIPESLKPAREAGIVGVIHKATEGSSYIDPKLSPRLYLARDAGLLWGLYHFLLPGAVRDQAEHFIAVADRYSDENTLLALDYEDKPSTPAASLQECVEWLALVEKAFGRKPVIYTGHVLKDKLAGKTHPVLNEDHYRLWLAQYAPEAKLPPGWSKFWLWQYTDRGTVAGVTPPTDLNAAWGDDVSSVTASWSGAVAPTPIPPQPAPEDPAAARHKAALEDIRNIADTALQS